MGTGDTVMCISKRGNRRGQRGILLGDLIQATQKYKVRWLSDGVVEAYPVKKLKKVLSEGAGALAVQQTPTTTNAPPFIHTTSYIHTFAFHF